MLVLNRKLNESIRARFGGEELIITVLSITRTQIRLGIVGPRTIEIDRLEVVNKQEATDTFTENDECPK